MATYHLDNDEARIVKIGLIKTKKDLEDKAKGLEVMGYNAEAGKLRADLNRIGEDIIPKFDEQLPLAMGGNPPQAEDGAGS